MKTILFNTEMTKAILDGRKVQTRRAIKDKFYYRLDEETKKLPYVEKYINDFIKENAKYQKGDTLWVREPAKITYHFNIVNEITFQYLADGEKEQISIPKRFLDKHNSYAHVKWIQNYQGIPNGCIKEMARIFLKVTNVRVERLQNMTFHDIHKEGCPIPFDDLSTDFKELNWWINLWNKTAPKGYKWEDNPYVFVYEFERVSNG